MTPEKRLNDGKSTEKKPNFCAAIVPMAVNLKKSTSDEVKQ
jgi:hypothetical protein